MKSLPLGRSESHGGGEALRRPSVVHIPASRGRGFGRLFPPGSCSCIQPGTQARPSALHADLLWLDCVLITKGLCCKCVKSDWKTIK